mmetsp:Transcript_129510/g.314583  ORF Transcript_129510/g.314583 Transcript_129510/m.314583 type:complete len:284 (-) Transcript_129510:701-1552(-)
MRRAKSLRIGVHHANAVVWGPVSRRRRAASLRRTISLSSSRGDELLAHAGLHGVLHVLPRPQIARHDVVQARVEDELVLVRLHGFVDDVVDVKVSNLLVEEHRHRLLVRGGEHPGHRPARPARGVPHRQRRVLLHVRRLEREVAHLHEVQTRPRRLRALDSLRPRHGVENRQTHVRPAELREDARVARLDHAVNDRLRVNDDVDVVVRGSVQVVRLDHLQGFIHQCRGVARDLRAHVPVGMRRRLLLQETRVVLRVLAHLREFDVAERASGRGQDDPSERALG